MSIEFATHDEVIQALKVRKKLIDVRAPVEFAAGSLPGSINLPILTDTERQYVGTEYKQRGPLAAIQLGEKLVSEALRVERTLAWSEVLKSEPESLLYCFRGGLRSSYAQTWLQEWQGRPIKRIEGGYKYYRNHLIKTLQTLPPKLNFIVLSGRTGSGKTKLLKALSDKQSCIDLEALAAHRGSAFGARSVEQPSQADFENKLAVELLIYSEQNQNIFIEDESRTIGKIILPEVIFHQMKEAKCVALNAHIEERAYRIFEEYVLQKFNDDDQNKLKVHESLSQSLKRIQQRLGGLRYANTLALLEKAFESSDFLNPEPHKEWIIYLLENYYDPLYERGRPKDSRIIFQGTESEVMERIYELNNSL